jgi:hypothetical protein
MKFIAGFACVSLKNLKSSHCTLNNSGQRCLFGVDNGGSQLVRCSELSALCGEITPMLRFERDSNVGMDVHHAQPGSLNASRAHLQIMIPLRNSRSFLALIVVYGHSSSAGMARHLDLTHH